MRQIDNMTPQEIDTLKLKGMLKEQVRRETAEEDAIENKLLKQLAQPTPANLEIALKHLEIVLRDRGRLREELPKMRNENKRLMAFLQDAKAYMEHATRNGASMTTVAATLYHDVSGLANDEPCFLPRVTGYAKMETAGKMVEESIRKATVTTYSGEKMVSLTKLEEQTNE